MPAVKLVERDTRWGSQLRVYRLGKAPSVATQQMVSCVTRRRQKENTISVILPNL